MTQTYFVTPTAIGEAKLANAAALGTTISITQMGVGDGNGEVPTPVSTQTALVNEVRRAALNSLSIDPDNANQIIAEQVIPDDEGGFWIREIGLFDADGNLLFVGNCPPSYKPLLAEGSGRTQTVRMIIIVSDTSTVTLKIDPSVVLATRQYVDNQAATKQPLDATLTALAALAGSANKLPYFTGNDALALADLSGFMRGLLGDADLSTLLSNLGLIDGLADGAIGRQVGFKRIESTQTFAPKAITQVVEVWLYAAGGGGGGVPAGSSTSCSVASGGSAGSWIRFLIPASLLRSGVTVTIGSAGTGGVAGGGTGGKGGDSLFGSFATAPGGPGGSYSTAPASGVSAGAGGQAAEPTLSESATLIDSSRGESGFPGYLVNASSGSSGHGGSGPEGSGGAGASGDGSGKGSGGSGARTLTSETTAMAGGKGTGGLCLIREWA